MNHNYFSPLSGGKQKNDLHIITSTSGVAHIRLANLLFCHMTLPCVAAEDFLCFCTAKD